MSIVIIINPHSGVGGTGKGSRRQALAHAALAACGESGTVHTTTHRGHARELAAAAVAGGARLVIAWGGDGTINEVGSALLHTSTALGIVRSGSGNGFARELGVDRDPQRAICNAIASEPRRIDAGEIDGRAFFCVAGVGFDSHVAAIFDRLGRARRGFTAYIRLAIREIWKYRPSPLVVDGNRVERAMLVSIANAAQFGNGATIAPRARLDDGLLDLVIFDERSRLATLLALPRLYVGGLERVAGVVRRQVKELVVESEHPIAFHADGELGAGGTRIVIRVLPLALRVAVR
jgi:diacylglycerol kinase (ATP)